MKSKTKHNKRKETALKIKLAKGGMEVDREVTAAITTGKKKGKLPKGKKPRDIPVQLREAIIVRILYLYLNTSIGLFFWFRLQCPSDGLPLSACLIYLNCLLIPRWLLWLIWYLVIFWGLS